MEGEGHGGGVGWERGGGGGGRRREEGGGGVGRMGEAEVEMGWDLDLEREG